MVWVDAVRIYGPSAGASLGETLALRGGLVVLTSVVAVVAGDFYGYIASLVGALGATTLSFIMPSLMHLRLFGGGGKEERRNEEEEEEEEGRGRLKRKGEKEVEVEEGYSEMEPLSALEKAKDVATIAIGVAGGVAGLIVTVQSWAQDES